MKKLLSILMLFASFSVSAQVGKWAPVSGGTVQKNSITGEYRWVFTGTGNTYDPTALYARIPTAPVGANHIITRMGITITSSKGRNIAAIDSGVYFFNGDTTAYTGATLRISAQDAYLSLYDVLYVDSTGTTNVIEGDLSATPSVPSAPDSTLVIAQILVTPTSVTNVPVPPPTYVTYNSWTGDVNGTGHKITISYLVIGGENTSNINLQAASSTPGTPLNGINIYDKGGFSWIGSDSFTRTLSDNNTANRNYHLPDTSGTFALTSQLPDLSGYATLSDLSPYATTSSLVNYWQHSDTTSTLVTQYRLAHSGFITTGGANFGSNVNITNGGLNIASVSYGVEVYNGDVPAQNTVLNYGGVIVNSSSGQNTEISANSVIVTNSGYANYTGLNDNGTSSADANGYTGYNRNGMRYSYGGFNLAIAFATPTANVNQIIPALNGTYLLYVNPPASSTDTGLVGQYAEDTSYFYWVSSTNHWCRIAKDATY